MGDGSGRYAARSTTLLPVDGGGGLGMAARTTFFSVGGEGKLGMVPRRMTFFRGLWCKRFEVEPSRRREVALDHAARTAFQILGAVLPLAPSLPSLN